MIKIRKAERTDLDWLFAECKAFAKTYPSKVSLTGNETYARMFLDNLICSHLVLIAEKDQARAGFIAGMVTAHHFNPDIKQLAELLWWVPIEHRMSGVGAKLFIEFVNYGKTHCDWITMTLEETTPISDKALEKRGFRLTEKAYLMECR